VTAKSESRSKNARERELSADALCWRCDPEALGEALGFETTEDVVEPEGFVGQPRVVAALEFGTGIEREGYNIFAFGPPGAGRHHLVEAHLRSEAARRPVPPDECYVHDFDRPHHPRLLRLPAGQGRNLREDMETLIEELGNVLPATFESEEYQNRRKAVEEKFEERQQEAWKELADEAREKGLSVAHTPMGLVFAPVREDKVLSPEEYRELPEDERKQLEAEVDGLRAEVEKILRRFPRWAREHRRKVQELDRETVLRAIEPLIDELQEKYGELEGVVEQLDRVQKDIVEHARAFIGGEEESDHEGPGLRRYSVNVLVDHGDSEGAPVVYENNPTLANVVGRVEHLSRMGTLVTDFTLIKPGALHRAHGGYLVLDADRVLRQPQVWIALKRALRSGQLRIESLAEALSLWSTVSLEPEPMPLEVKVVLVGEPMLYYLLSFYDSEFTALFKVAADFSDRLDRNDGNEELYVRLVAGMVRQEKLRPFSRAAVARVLEHSARQAGDTRKLSLLVGSLLDLLREADHWSRQAGRETAEEVVTAEDVQRALDAGIFRADRMREEIQEHIRRGVVLLDTDGEAVGQINGLSVIQLDRFAFGRPTRITARARLGEGEVVDIEREVELAGPLHSKGVMILSGFLSQRYVPGLPLSLSATLVFEQSYGGVEGDSASLAELCTLLSALGEVPIDQSLALTGSVNQHGAVQPIGGVNEKIEGFFDVCDQRGLTGRQGVVIPRSNVEHLMLRRDVVDAVTDGRFHIYRVETVDEALEILTGLPAGQRGEDGSYPEESFNGRVEARLAAFASLRMAFQQGKVEQLAEAGEGSDGEGDDGSEGGPDSASEDGRDGGEEGEEKETP
jgi:lon-related putative ATP-dependent protease